MVVDEQKSRRRRRRLMVFAALFAVYLAVSGVVGRWMITSRGSCPQPCRDLGLVVHAPGDKDSYPIYRPQCRPLALELELYEPKAPRNTRYTLWYRMKMTNTTCYRIGYVHAYDFTQTAETSAMGYGTNWGHGVTLEILDPDGAAMQPVQYHGQMEFLYYLDKAQMNAFYEKHGIGVSDPLIELAPGEFVETVPSVLAPLKSDECIDWNTGNHGDCLRPRPIPPDAVKPPPGFKILDDFVFTKPGKYTIQAKYEKDLDATPVRPYAKRTLPFEVGISILDMFGVDIYPDVRSRIEQRYHVLAESKKIEFEVAR